MPRPVHPGRPRAVGRALLRAGVGVLVTACTATAAAQTTDPPVAAIVARDSSARMERLADGVFVIIHDDATEDWPHGNTGVVVGTDGVLVVDTDYYPARAAADVALVRRVTDRPVRWLVNTHWHGDHTHGNAVYRDAFPGVAIVGPRESRYWIALNQAAHPQRVRAEGSPARTTLARLERDLARGADSTGRALGADERRALAVNVRQRRVELEELGRVRVAPPTVLFDDALAIDVGGRMVELRNRGRANSPADVTVHLPAERILFAGDILVHPLPYVGGSFPRPWIGVLRELEAVPLVALVPGHGRVLRDHAYTRQVRALFETAQARADSLYRAGRRLREVPPLIDLRDLRATFPLDDGKPASPELWAAWSGTLAERMAQCVHGYAC